MKKYIDALYRLDDGEHTIEDFELLKKLAKEKDKQDSRKDKLVVGSEWECVKFCFVLYKKEVILTTLYDDCKVVGFDDLMVSILFDGKTYLLPKDQFLLCFKPKGEKL